MEFNRHNVVLTVLMLASGTLVTLSGKYPDLKTKSEADWVEGKDGVFGEFSNGSKLPPHQFHHPFVLTGAMLLGEIMNLGAYFLKKRLNPEKSNQSRKPELRNVYIFVLPAMCDMFGTNLGYFGLNFTTASMFLMISGSVIIFTGIFSRIFLQRHLNPDQWLGMLTVFVGLVIVGVADYQKDVDESAMIHSKRLAIIGN
eukprot:18553_1